MVGCLQIYTGDGKGKTTAAFGLTLRAVGAGLNVFIAQFVKGMKYSELDAIRLLGEHVTLNQYGRDCFIYQDPEMADIEIARQGLEAVREAMLSGNYDVIIMDEANIAVYYNLFSIDELLALIDQKPENVELVITGRLAHERLIERADLVTEMKEIKHYYQQGVQARTGIEK